MKKTMKLYGKKMIRRLTSDMNTTAGKNAKVTPKRTIFARCLEAGGEVIRLQAGGNGSIQGPAEAKWGYTTLSAADWDHDGDYDMFVANSLENNLYLNDNGIFTDQLAIRGNLADGIAAEAAAREVETGIQQQVVCEVL